MKGKYKNLQGEPIEILEYDEANKIVYIRNSEGEKKWIASEECRWWQRLDKPVEEVKVEQLKNQEPPAGMPVELDKLEEVIVETPQPVEKKEEPKTTKIKKKKG